MEYVLITGGSSGIGFALAKKFAADHYGILLAASSQERLNTAKKKLEKEYQAEVHTYAFNLAELGVARRLYDSIKADGFSVSVLVNNAGTGVLGATEKIDFRKDEQMMLLNMITPVELTKLFLPEMYRKKNGRILNVSSTGAFQPGPYISTYYASKDFLFSYSQAVRYEAKQKGVSVCTLCPGTTDTNFFQRAGGRTPKGAMSAEKVADYAYRRLMKNKAVTIPGISYRLMKLCPVKIKTMVIAKVKKPKKGVSGF